ncbi:MAG TPA: hypothetical protein VJ785_19230, partial [Anaerolineales bacterium]|nr:hypothetical protein [Anaerolineales bacterium]
MHATPGNKRIDFMGLGQFLLPILLFWLILIFEISYSFSQYFHGYSAGLFLIVLLIYYLAFRLPDRYRVLASFGWTMLLFALTLSFMWTSGFSDNKVIAGLLPYKDGAGYYLGANLILNGLPLENTLQAGWRPLFPGFLSSMLFLSGGSLKLVLAALVLLAGTGSYFASRQVYAWLGAFPASLFITFLYFYIQPLVGLTMTELLGFTMGCMAFAILWMTSFHPRMMDLVFGILLLVLAMSVRAGTFLMLPFIAVWAGRVFRGAGSFSWQAFAVAWSTILLGYLAFNSIYVRLIGIPEGKVFGNFAYSLYGQVQGGTGWHRAIEELGTRDPSIVYKAAFQFFLDHPFSLVIGILKSYR